MENLRRKMKLMESDLDSAEDKGADHLSKSKGFEEQVEELTRDNRQLNHRIGVLEGK